MIPNHSRQGTPLAPDQIFHAGFRDGMNDRAPLPQFQHHFDYLKGYADGCRSRLEQTTLIRFCSMSSLDSALQSIASWEKDQKHYGFGTVALEFQDNRWLVLVSKDLHDAALPF